MNFSQSPPRFRGFCPIPVILSPFHGNRGLTGGLATLPQGNQEPLMVKRNVGKPPGEHDVGKTMECDTFSPSVL